MTKEEGLSLGETASLKPHELRAMCFYSGGIETAIKFKKV